MEKNIIIRFRDLTVRLGREKLISSPEGLEDFLEGLDQGSLVDHHSFGRGIIRQIQGDRIRIQFEDKTRVFAYPASFSQGYLKPVD